MHDPCYCYVSNKLKLYCLASQNKDAEQTAGHIYMMSFLCEDAAMITFIVNNNTNKINIFYS